MDKIVAPIKDRMKIFIKSTKVNRDEFLEATGISYGNYRRSESELGGDKIAKILAAYPEINPDWLLLGIGNMLRDIEDNRTKVEYMPVKDVSEMVDNIISRFEEIFGTTVQYTNKIIESKDEIIFLQKQLIEKNT